MPTRKPSHHVRPRVEAMESRALLSALALLPGPHHHGAGIAEVRRRRNEQGNPASVNIGDQCGFPIWVKAQVYENGSPTAQPVEKQITSPSPVNFSNFQYTPRGQPWQIQILVGTSRTGPFQGPLPLTAPSFSGYYGANYSITLIGSSFNVNGPLSTSGGSHRGSRHQHHHHKHHRPWDFPWTMATLQHKAPVHSFVVVAGAVGGHALGRGLDS